MGAPVTPRPAATVVLVRDSPSGPEVFLVRRHEGTAFMGGAHVFPGGRVDDGDRDGDAEWCDGTDEAAKRFPDMPRPEAVAYHVAAIRELFEEAGILLARDLAGGIVSHDKQHPGFDAYRIAVHSGQESLRSVVDSQRLRLALDVLIPFAHWVTPPVDTRRFDTRFFVTRMPQAQTAVHDRTETTHSDWMTPAAAIALAQSGKIILPPPTWTTLREIESFATVASALAWAASRAIVRRQPHHLEHEGKRMLVLAGDPLFPRQASDDGLNTAVPEDVKETRFIWRDNRWWAEQA